jgi:hypothetical protein
MGLLLEDLDDHEGYADRRLAPHGELAWGLWSHNTQQFTGYVAACSCGWHGSVDYPPTQEGEELAVQAWRLAHAQPLLAHQAERRQVELARVLEWLGGQAGRLHDPTVDRVRRAIDRTRGLVDDVQRDLERQAPEREADRGR